jgi:hypothetical protein
VGLGAGVYAGSFRVGWLPRFSHGRRDLVDQALARLEVAVGERGDDSDELFHRVSADAQRVGVRVTRAGERGEVRLGQSLDQCRVHEDALGDDVGLLTRGVTAGHVVRGGKGLDVLRRDTEHDFLDSSRRRSYRRIPYTRRYVK